MPDWEIRYENCPRCGATVIVTRHWMTGSRIEVDPLPVSDGNVDIDFGAGRSKVIPLKQAKKYAVLWMPHVGTCPAL